MNPKFQVSLSHVIICRLCFAIKASCPHNNIFTTRQRIHNNNNDWKPRLHENRIHTHYSTL